MESEKNNSLKLNLAKLCSRSLAERRRGIEEALSTIKEGLLGETKSSMGDKFETTRAHLQREEAKLKSQLGELSALESRMDIVKRTNSKKIAALGSVVRTNYMNYYLAVPVGKLELEEETFYAISPVSPIGKLLLEKEKNEVFTFNKKEIKILEVL